MAAVIMAATFKSGTGLCEMFMIMLPFWTTYPAVTVGVCCKSQYQRLPNSY